MYTTCSSDTSKARGRGAAKDVLVAGIGNCVFGDDGLGVEVAHELASRPIAAQVRIVGEPEDLSPGVERSSAVRKAVLRALEMVKRIVQRELGGATWPTVGKSFS
jgi:Ni,Fe-hydrogenase maturation factor